MCLGALPSFRASDSFHFIRGGAGASNRGSYGLPSFLPSFPSSASSLLKLRVWCSGAALRCVCVLFRSCATVRCALRSGPLGPSGRSARSAPSFLSVSSWRVYSPEVFTIARPCKSEPRSSILSQLNFLPSLSVYVVAERRHDLRGGEDDLRPRHLEGRRKEVLLQQPDLRRPRRRPRGPPLVFAVLQQSAGDEEQVPGSPAWAGAGAATTGIHRGDDEGESVQGQSFRAK